MNYYKGGSLRKYLDENNDLYWIFHLKHLCGIAYSLKHIHERDFVHRDLHSGNILTKGEFYASVMVITDLGLSRPEGSNRGKNEITGVLPYIAPEVLQGKDYTKKADIYSFGILCYEIITRLRPHHDMAHDAQLALKIIKGFRPKFKMMVPELLLDLINQCWNSDPSKRPDAKNVHETLSKFCEDLDIPNYESEFYKQYDEADEYNKKYRSTKSTQQSTNAQLTYISHPQAVYTSRVFKPLSGELDLKISEIDMDCYDEGQ